MPLRGGLVNVYRFLEGGEAQFEPLTQVTQKTDAAGNFSFSNLPVLVEVQMAIPSTPPYTPVEITRVESLPNLVFRISLDPEVFVGSALQGIKFEEIYDERELIKSLDPEEYMNWKETHKVERFNVKLSGKSLSVLIPEENAIAAQVAGIAFPPVTVPGKEFHFLRVGRVVRQEIGELNDARAEYLGKPGYMRSSDTWAASLPSFIPKVYDAPFGATLHIGGQFGADLLSKEMYYTVSVWDYSGDPNNPLAGKPAQILDPLFNKRYIMATGKWETMNLGPFTGTITAVEPPHDPALVGGSVQVYKRPAPPNLLAEYWPFWDLMVLWNSATSPDDLRILSLEAYEKIGGSDANPHLRKIALMPSVNGHLPLRIDNRPPVPVLLPFDPAESARKFSRSYARYLPSGTAQSIVGAVAAIEECNEMTVVPGDGDGNQCILVRYSVQDGSGNPHQHLKFYELYAEFTPKAVSGAPDSKKIDLLPSFAGNYPHAPHDPYQPISRSYSPVSPPLMVVGDFKSVVVPDVIDGWPPESGDIYAIPTGVCPQYAVEVGLRCWVRTIDGWGAIFGTPHVSRHIIVRRS